MNGEVFFELVFRLLEKLLFVKPPETSTDLVDVGGRRHLEDSLRELLEAVNDDSKGGA